VTASTLLFYISSVLLAQLVLGIAVSIATRKAPARALAAPAAVKPTGAAWSGLRAFRVVRRSFEDAAQTQCSFYLEPVDGQTLPPYKPGQFLTFQLLLPADASGEARSITRCYSLSDGPLPNHYRVTIKRVVAPAAPAGLPAGVASHYFHDQVHVGDTLQLRAPAGHFHLDTEALTPVVLIAGGIGITPMMSMLRWCAQHQPQRAVHLYYGVRNSTEQAYKAELESMARQLPQLRLHAVYSKPLPQDQAPHDYQHLGHVDMAVFKQTLPHGLLQFYICGPAAMLESLVPGLTAWGVASANLHFEAFGPASLRLPAATAVAPMPLDEALEIQFTRSGRTLQWTGQHANLLDFAEAHGIAVESGCRSGGCGSCLTQVASGSVEYAHAPDFDLSPGQCLLCVGKPRGPLVVES
jgi:ferredoxin-NADP reductase